MIKEDLKRIMPTRIENFIFEKLENIEKLMEIRFRVDKPLIIIYDNQEFFVDTKGELVKNSNDGIIIKIQDIREVLDYISDYSLYAFEDEIRQGFITIAGGHRIGITGKTIIEDKNIKSINYISCMNIRVSHEIKGCSDDIIKYLIDNKHNSILNTLIISPPRCGKTTLLRDLIRNISDGNKYIKGVTVGVVDERSEIGASYMGVAQNNLGIRTDILDCCPKSKGILMLIRSMSPQVIAVDEIGTKEDVESIEYATNSGCKLIATVHGNDIKDIENKPYIGKLVKNNVFDKYIIMSNSKAIGKIEEIIGI